MDFDTLVDIAMNDVNYDFSSEFDPDYDPELDGTAPGFYFPPEIWEKIVDYSGPIKAYEELKGLHQYLRDDDNVAGFTARDVWSLIPEPFSGINALAFAVYKKYAYPALVEGTSIKMSCMDLSYFVLELSTFMTEVVPEIVSKCQDWYLETLEQVVYHSGLEGDVFVHYIQTATRMASDMLDLHCRFKFPMALNVNSVTRESGESGYYLRCGTEGAAFDVCHVDSFPYPGVENVGSVLRFGGGQFRPWDVPSFPVLNMRMAEMINAALLAFGQGQQDWSLLQMVEHIPRWREAFRQIQPPEE